ncbi:hypothetical protein IMY05_013G0010600 [Salix suchowensis]|nr:hypothetical protein IMY05_013G0010600 [Salix suchowensis]
MYQTKLCRSHDDDNYDGKRDEGGRGGREDGGGERKARWLRNYEPGEVHRESPSYSRSERYSEDPDDAVWKSVELGFLCFKSLQEVFAYCM